MSDLINRKRSFEEADSDYEPSGLDAHGEKRPQENDYETNKRRRVRHHSNLPPEIETLKEICGGISRLGEHKSLLSSDLVFLSRDIANWIGEGDFKQNFLSFIYANVVEQPEKMQIVSLLVRCCNVRNADIGEAVVSHFSGKIEETLTKIQNGQLATARHNGDDNEPGEVTRLKLESRFLALLAPILTSTDPVLELFHKLISTSISLQEQKPSYSGLAEELYVSFMLSVPYLVYATDSVEEIKQKCSKVVEEGSKFEIKHSTYPEKFALCFHSEDKNLLPYEPTRIASLVVDSVKDLDVSVFADYHAETVEALERVQNDDKAKNSESKEPADGDVEMKEEDIVEKKHEIPSFEVPSADEFAKIELSGTVDSLWKYPRFFNEVFTQGDSSFATIPPKNSYVRLLLQDIIQDEVQNMEFNRITVSRHLMGILGFINDKLFAKLNSSDDKLTIVNDMLNGVDLVENLESNPEIPDNMKEKMLASAKKIQVEFEEGYKSTWKIEQVVTEAVADLMLHVPSTTLPAVYYQNLLADTCGRDWALMKKSEDSAEKVAFAKTVASAIDFFYRNGKTLDYDARRRFICWMAVQLGSFNFEWKWTEWLDEFLKLGESTYHPTVYMLHNIVGKEVRLSTPSFIRSTLPKQLHQFTDLSLLDQDQVLQFDTLLFGDALAKQCKEANAEFLKSDFEDAKPSDEAASGNAETFHLLNQYLFNNEDHIFHETCHNIYTNMQEGESLQSFNDLIAELTSQIKEADESEQPKCGIARYIVVLVTQSVCVIGSRSLSVIDGGALELCGDKIRKVLGLELKDKDTDAEDIDNDQFSDVSDTQQRQKWVIEAVLRLWNREPRIGYLILEKMRNKDLVTSSQIVESLFTAHGTKIPALTELYADELLDRLLLQRNLGEGEDDEAEEDHNDQKWTSFAKSCLKTLNTLISDYKDEAEEKGTIDIKSSEKLACEDATVAKKSTDLLWAIDGLLQLVESKLKKEESRKEKLEIFKGALSEVEDTDIQEQVKKLLGEFDEY